MQSNDECMELEEEDEVWSDDDMDDITYEWDPEFYWEFEAIWWRSEVDEYDMVDKST